MTNESGRRDILKAGFLAAAALASSSPAAAAAPLQTSLGALRTDYLGRIKAFAAAHPEFKGAAREWDYDAAKRLETACRAAFCATEDEARLMFALSPHWDVEDEIGTYDVRDTAAVCVACDVAAAVGATWYLEGWSLDVA